MCILVHTVTYGAQVCHFIQRKRPPTYEYSWRTKLLALLVTWHTLGVTSLIDLCPCLVMLTLLNAFFWWQKKIFWPCFGEECVFFNFLNCTISFQSATHIGSRACKGQIYLLGLSESFKMMFISWYLPLRWVLLICFYTCHMANGSF